MNSRYRSSQFLTSVREFRQLPADQGSEVAFAGRSNAGKSSALNTLTQQRALARTSKTPGRTQMINFFQVEPGRRLVDLPGYGYAKVPAQIRRHWDRLLQRYLSERKTLRGLFIIMDIRHPLTLLDEQLLDWCEHGDLSSHILLTKSDKLSFGASSKTLTEVQHVLKNHYPHASAQLFSALRRIGIKEAHAQLDQWLYSDRAQEVHTCKST
jgi:GTP-binding protein